MRNWRGPKSWSKQLTMITTIVVDDENRDTAATNVGSVLSNRGGAEVVTLSDFLLKAGVQFDADSGSLKWDQEIFHEHFQDARSRRICNRVVSIGKQTMAALDSHQHVISSNLVFSQYARLLQEFSQVWGTPGMYSPVGHLLPLNLQWRLFAARIRDISTPKFVYGFGTEKVDVSDFRQPIWKSPFDVYGWKPAEEINVPRLHPFVVDKPSGYPVILFFAGEAAAVFPLGSPHDVDDRVRERLINRTNDIKNMFGAFMGETLFFLDQDELTFAAFSHYLKTSLADKQLSDVLDRGLV
jgi:hypothetical protein